MKPQKFNELALNDKVWLVYEFGNYLLSIEYYDFWIHLCEFNGEYVELFQSVESSQFYKISIATYAELDKYLPRIVIGTFKKNK